MGICPHIGNCPGMGICPGIGDGLGIGISPGKPIGVVVLVFGSKISITYIIASPSIDIYLTL
jgi:phage shock protein PspC (stress-responsive transcriptional regulator)